MLGVCGNNKDSVIVKDRNQKGKLIKKNCFKELNVINL